MNRPVRATDVVNFVMKNGEIRPLVVVRSWDSTSAPVAAVPALPSVPLRAGEQVKFPGHNQPTQFAVAHVNGLLLIDPAVDGTNVPIQAPVMVPAVPAAPLSASGSVGSRPGGGIDFRNRGLYPASPAMSTDVAPVPVSVNAPVALPPVEGNAFSVWIAAAAYDQGKGVGTWHWPLGS